MERQKRNTRKKPQVEPIMDDHHSHETPPCNLVVQVVKDVIPAAVSQEDPTSEASLLGSLVLKHMLEQRRHRSSIKPKPKKRRKKKNKNNKSSEESDGAVATPTGLSQRPHSPTHPNEQNPETPLADQTSPVVSQWLDQLDNLKQAETANRTLSSFCQALCRKPCLFTNDISKALALAKCVKCRAAAESYWQSTGIPMQDLGLIPGDHHTEKVVLEASMIDLGISKRSIPIMGILNGDNDDDVDPAFNYQAMEEGLVMTNRKSSLSEAEAKDNEIVALEPVVDKDGKIEAIQVSSPLDACSVERLIRQIILPCGLAELEHPNATPITDEQLTTIEDYVTEHQRQMHAQLADLRDKKASAQALFRAASVNTSQTTNYSVKEANALTECDKECDQLLRSFVAILLQMTTMTDGLPKAQWAHLRTKWLWDSFQQELQKIFDKSLLHENKLLQLANRPGVVPQMFMNAAHRSSFFEVVKEKYNVLDAFYVNFFSTLQDETESPSGPTFLRSLITHQPFVNGTVLESNSWFNPTALDNMCASLMETYCELIQIVRNAQLSEVQKEQERRCARLFDVVEQAGSMLAEECRTSAYNNVDRGRLDELRNEGSQFLLHYKTFLPRRAPTDDAEFNPNFNADGTVELAAMRQQLILLVVNMISQWRCLRWMRSQTREAPVMPLRLLTLMNKGEFEPPVSSACNGSGGKRRFACVLASLLYQCLIVHCNEWHAELTQSELLESMGQFDGAVEVKGSNKKRKKKKAASSAAPAVISEKLEDAKSVDTSDSDDFFEVAMPAPANHVIEGNVLVSASTNKFPNGNVNGVYKAGVDETKEDVTDDAFEPDLIEEREPELIVNSRKGRRGAKVNNRSIPGVDAGAVVLPDADNAAKSETRTNPPSDVTSSKKQRDRQRKPSPPKEVFGHAKPLLLNEAIDPTKPKGPGKHMRPPPAPATAAGKSKASKDSPKQGRPSATIGTPAPASADFNSRTPKGSTRQSKTKIADDKGGSVGQNLDDAAKDKRSQALKDEDSSTQIKASPLIEVGDSKDSSKQRKPSPPNETRDVKTHHKESRKQRKPSPLKATVDSSSPKLKSPQINATPPREINNVKSKDTVRKGQKIALKDQVEKKHETTSFESKVEGSNSSGDAFLSAAHQPNEPIHDLELTQEATADEIDSKKENVVTRGNEQDFNGNRMDKKSNKSKNLSRDADEGESTATVEKGVSIGVEDGSGGVEPVEDFLVSRLSAILVAGSNDANGNPIIFL